MDNLLVLSCDRDCDPDINPYIHVQNGFIHFCYHELTQSHNYNQGLIYYHAINRNNKWLNVLILLLLLPTRQELINWLKLVGILISVAEFGVDYGISISFTYDLNEYDTSCLQYFTPLTHTPPPSDVLKPL